MPAPQPLKWVPFHIPLGRGVDTKTDARVLSPPRHAKVENLVMEEVGGLQKAPGAVAIGLNKIGGGTIATNRMRAIATRDRELVLFAEGRCWSLSDKDQKWHDRGRCEQVLADQRTIAHDRSDQVLADRAETGNMIGYVWRDETNQGVRYQFVDKANRMVESSSTASFVSGGGGGGPTNPRIRALNGKLLVFWVEGAAQQNLKVDIVDPADVYNTVGSPVTLATDALGAFDVDTFSATELVLAYRTNANQVKVIRLNNAATISTTRTVARACDTFLAVNYHPTTDRVGLARYDDGGGGFVRFDWLKSDLTDDTNVNILVATEGTTPIRVHQMSVLVMAGNAAYLVWDVVNTTFPMVRDLVKRAVITTGAAVTTKVLVRRSRLGSRLALWNDAGTERALVHVVHNSKLQGCYMLLDAAFVVGDTNGATVAGEEVGILARMFPQQGVTAGGSPIAANGCLPQIESIGGSQFAFAGGFKSLLGPNQYTERGIRDVVYTFSDGRAYRGVEEGRALYLPGGYVAHYDGQRVTEQGILIYPEDVVITPVNAGGTFTSGQKVSYRFYWERRNAAGERFQSSFAGAVLATMTPGNDSFQIDVPVCPYTNDANMVLAVYRTAELTGGGDPNVYRRCSKYSGPTFVRNNVNADIVTITDEMTDAELADNELDYQNADPQGRTELDNTSPPATVAVAAGQARLFTIDPEDRSLGHHGKIRGAGYMAAFNDALDDRVPQDGGDLVAIEVQEGARLLFKEKATYVVVGRGPDNLGQNPYPPPERVADVGCDEIRSVVRTPVGTFFHSKKGIYRITPDYAVDYVGAPVEDFNSASILAALHIPDKHQVRFVTAANGTLVYDYLLGEWAVWPERSGRSGTLWQDQPVYLDAALGPVKPQTTYAIGSTGYSFVVETGWIKLADIQGFAAIREALFLLEWRSSHDLKVSVAFDYRDPAVYGWIDGDRSGVFTWTPVDRAGVALATPGQVEQFRLQFRNTRCEAIKFRIEDTHNTPGALRESAKLIAISLLVGLLDPPFARTTAAQTK